MKTITHDGQTWHATSAGTSYFADGQDNMRVRFWCPATDKEAFGRLPGIAIQDFDKATAEQLRSSLADALSPDEDSN